MSEKRTLSSRMLAPFQRSTSSGFYFPEIDGLRCLAIVLVVLFHSHGFYTSGDEPSTTPELIEAGWGSGLAHFLPSVVGKGWFGVQIFFVISGFVLAIPYAAHYLKGRPRPDARSYFKRRLIRIELPYIIALTLLYFIISLSFKWGMSAMLPHYGAGLIYAHNIIFDAHNPLLNVSWTLELEVQFYLAIPLLCQVFRLPALPRRLLLIVTILLVNEFSGQRDSGLGKMIWGWTFLGQLQWFAGGIMLADLILTRQQKRSHLWDIAGVLSAFGVIILMDFYFDGAPRVWCVLFGFWAVLHGKYLGRLFRNPWVTAVGMMCYTIYLSHMILMHGLIQPSFINPHVPFTEGAWPWNFFVELLLASLVILCCVPLYFLIEKPFIKGRLPWGQKK